MELLVSFFVPFIVTGIMFVFKRLAGLAWFANGAEAHPFLRILLIALSLVGMLSTSLVTGKELDIDSVSALAQLAFFTLLSAYGSHWIYKVLDFIRTVLNATDYDEYGL